MEDWSYAETVTWLVKRDGKEAAAPTENSSAEHQKYERALIALTLSVDPSKVIDIDAVDQMIFKAPRAGQITVEGLENGRREYRPIPTKQFRDSAFFDNSSAGLMFGHDNWGNNSVPKWTRIGFNPGQIRNNWPQSSGLFEKLPLAKIVRIGLMSDNSDKETV